MANTLITDRRSTPAVYKTIRRLGKGGMAEVFLARQEGVAGFRRLAVVKRLLPQFSALKNVAEMLLDEARIAAQLNHPNIVQIFELGEEEGQYFIAMEYVDGCDVATLARIERRRKGRVPIRLALRMLSEAAMGLDYAHRQVGLDGRPLNLVHRDVSPHNILCSREGAVKVTDFGIAKAVGKVQVTEVGVVKGKVHYMSPEQYTGGDVDKRSDIFSLGVVLYQLTTGRLPRVSKSGQVNMRQVAEGRIPRPVEIRSDFPEDLDGIVMRALAQEPDERYQDCAAFRDDLLEFARRNDLLAFPNELGDYVDALVPAQPVFDPPVRSGTDGDQQRDEDGDAVARPPAVLSAAAESVGPAGTERVSLHSPLTEIGHRHRTPVRSAEDTDSETEIPIESERPTLGPAVDREALRGGRRKPRPTRKGRAHDELLYESLDAKAEVIVPLGKAESKARPAPSRRRRARELAHAKADSENAESTKAESTKAESATPRRPIRRPMSAGMTWAGAAAGAGALVLLVIGLLYVLVTRGSTSPVATMAAMRGQNERLEAGELGVMSEPAKAAVFVDGAQRCASTPCDISGLPLGRELVVTVRGGPKYDLWVQRVVLSEDKPRLMIKATLTTARSGKAMRAAGRGKGGKAKGNNGTSGGSTKKARHARRSSTGGHRSKGKRGKGKVEVVKIDKSVALLATDVRPGWAEIWVDGKQVGHTPLQFAVPVGRHTIELKNPQRGFEATYRVNCKNGTKTKITDKIEAKAPGQN